MQEIMRLLRRRTDGVKVPWNEVLARQTDRFEEIEGIPIRRPEREAVPEPARGMRLLRREDGVLLPWNPVLARRNDLVEVNALGMPVAPDWEPLARPVAKMDAGGIGNGPPPQAEIPKEDDAPAKGFPGEAPTTFPLVNKDQYRDAAAVPPTAVPVVLEEPEIEPASPAPADTSQEAEAAVRAELTQAPAAAASASLVERTVPFCRLTPKQCDALIASRGIGVPELATLEEKRQAIKTWEFVNRARK